MEGIKIYSPKVSTLPQSMASKSPAPAGTSTTSIKPKVNSMKSTEGMAVRRYRSTKRRVQFYTLKLRLFGMLSKGDQFLLDKYKNRLMKLRKIAAPELIQNLLKKRASRGRGKKRGSDLNKLMSKNLVKLKPKTSSEVPPSK